MPLCGVRKKPLTEAEITTIRCNAVQAEQALYHQPVVLLRPLLASVHVDASLAGRRVKVKVSGRRGTYFKSDAHRVSRGCDPVVLCEPSHSVVFEGDDTLTFELCRARSFLSSAPIARGGISVKNVISSVGIKDTGNWDVELLARDGRLLGTLGVNIMCTIRRLGVGGGGTQALKLHQAPRPPFLKLLNHSDTTLAHHVAKMAHEYTADCAALQALLEEAFATAREAAPEQFDQSVSESSQRIDRQLSQYKRQRPSRQRPASRTRGSEDSASVSSAQVEVTLLSTTSTDPAEETLTPGDAPACA